ncbi:hypothetical protein GGX14DRAFT_582969 [Mycena pura]|uniref:F-box domain-containing protein n=1 Tax=Mycena pura TaxID=153505 RepID=A0AAD7E5Q3_9AGAR|nr:hypothetical protein GGX14DRAFT_582969 [Mycena pura]
MYIVGGVRRTRDLKRPRDTIQRYDSKHNNHALLDDSSCPTCGGPTYRDTLQTSLFPVDPHVTTAELRASLEEVQTAILRLHRKEQELERRLGLVVYPVLTLPNEMVSRIFIECLPSHGRVRPSKKAAPLLFAQICRRWRDIAFETCELWSSVDLDSIKLRHSVDQSLLESWLSRGKKHQLSLTLRGVFPFKFPISAFIPTIAHRLWRLELCLDRKSYMELAKNRTSFPSLRQLALFGDTTLDELQEKHPIFSFSDAPLLRELNIASPPGSLKLDLYSLLTTLDTSIRFIPSATLLSIMQRLPQLLHVTARLDKGRSSGPAIISPSLKSLILSGHCPNILDFLTLPALCRLEVDTVPGPGVYIYTSSCLKFFERSACTLDHLAIYLDDGHGLTACLDAMPTVTSLRINARDMALIARILSATPLLVPRLTTLALRLFEAGRTYHLSLPYFLCKRFPLGLVSVKVDLVQVGDWFPPADCLVKLNELISDGMDVELRCSDSELEEYWNGGEYYPQQVKPKAPDPCETFP